MTEEFGLPPVPLWVLVPAGVVFGPMLFCIGVACVILWATYHYHERSEE